MAKISGGSSVWAGLVAARSNISGAPY